MKKEGKKRKDQKVNLILSLVNPIFLILDLLIGPQTFRHTHCTIKKSVFLMWERVQFKVRNAVFDSFLWWSWRHGVHNLWGALEKEEKNHDSSFTNKVVWSA